MWLLLGYDTDGMSERFERSQVGQWRVKAEVLFKPDLQEHVERWTGVGRLRLTRSIADRLLFKVKSVFVVRYCKTGEVAVMNYDKIRNDQRY